MPTIQQWPDTSLPAFCTASLWDKGLPQSTVHPALPVTHLRIFREDIVHQPLVPGTKGTAAATHTWDGETKAKPNLGMKPSHEAAETGNPGPLRKEIRAEGPRALFFPERRSPTDSHTPRHWSFVCLQFRDWAEWGV